MGNRRLQEWKVHPNQVNKIAQKLHNSNINTMITLNKVASSSNQNHAYQFDKDHHINQDYRNLFISFQPDVVHVEHFIVEQNQQENGQVTR